MKFLKRKYIERGYLKGDWPLAMEQYLAHYEMIKDRLLETAKLLDAHFRMWEPHDSVVDAITRPSRDALHVDLGQRRLEFFEVADCDIPNTLNECTWLYDEMDLTDADHFELSVLIRYGNFRVVAREVRVFDKH